MVSLEQFFDFAWQYSQKHDNDHNMTQFYDFNIGWKQRHFDNY